MEGRGQARQRKRGQQRHCSRSLKGVEIEKAKEASSFMRMEGTVPLFNPQQVIAMIYYQHSSAKGGIYALAVDSLNETVPST